jgi:hypothetical protein
VKMRAHLVNCAPQPQPQGMRVPRERQKANMSGPGDAFGYAPAADIGGISHTPNDGSRADRGILEAAIADLQRFISARASSSSGSRMLHEPRLGVIARVAQSYYGSLRTRSSSGLPARRAHCPSATTSDPPRTLVPLSAVIH